MTARLESVTFTSGDGETRVPSYLATPDSAGPHPVVLILRGVAGPDEGYTEIARRLADWGYVALVHPRSGLAARHGLSIVNTPGTVDAGYRGEVKVMLINHDPVEPVELRRGDRIAQLVVQRFERAEFTEVEALPASVRGDGGYGSTGGFGRS